ncbi:MAG: YaeQ family protein, partial [Nitrospiria bacterium]
CQDRECAHPALSTQQSSSGCLLVRTVKDRKHFSTWIEGSCKITISFQRVNHYEQEKQAIFTQDLGIYSYGGHKADRWWERGQATLEREKNLTIMNLQAETSRALAALAQRDIQLHCTIQDGQIWMSDGDKTVPVTLAVLKNAQPSVR